MLLRVSIMAFMAFAGRVSAEDTYFCNATVSCPESAPCCSQFGTCGTGLNCLGGCNPIFSNRHDACMPEPTCKDLSTKFDNYTSKVINVNDYLGNASEADWIYSGNILDYEDEKSMIMAMPKNSGGSVLSSTHDIWYGKVSVRMKTSHLGGVVSAFILFSNVQDELDFEWIGADINMSQTNYYWQGLLDYHNSVNISTKDTYNDFHVYEIDWHEDHTTWSIDGVVGRILQKNDTWNETLQVYKYPQTPAKIQFSIWPGGNSTNAPGTIAWAGGEINWDAPDISNPGYYYTIINEVNVTCYDTPAGTTKNGTTSFEFKNDSKYLEGDVLISNKRFYLGSQKGTGLDVDAGVSSSSSAASSSSTTKGKSSSTSNSNSGKSSQSTDSSTKSTTSGTSSKATSTSTSSTKSNVSTKSKNMGNFLELDNAFFFLSTLFGLLL